MMTPTQRLIQRLLEERTALAEQRDAILAAVEAEGRAALTDVEGAEFNRLDGEIRSIDDRLPELEEQLAREQAAEAAQRRLQPALQAGPSVRINNEPLTYRRGGPHSYFRDLAAARAEGGEDPAAIARLAAHRDEVRALAEAAGAEIRANMSRTDGTGGEFVPPLWLMDQYLALARAGRVTADLVRRVPLPAGTDSINIPRVATGTATAEQTDGSTVQKTDMTTGSISAPVTTLAGQQVFAMQLLDQSPLNFDEVVFADLLADLAVRVDAYVLSKAAIGILNVGSINAVTYTDASPTVAELYPKIADAVQQIHTGRFLPPQAIVMHPRRWAWMVASLDLNNRPLVVPSAQGPMNAFAGMNDVRSEGAVGTLQGLPVYVDPNVPINLGAGTNEDRVIVARFDDLFLFEGDIRTRVLFETDADTLSVRLQVWEYAAFTGARYPKSISVVAGTGLITPTF